MRAPTLASSTSRASPKSPVASERRWSSTWRTSPVWSPAGVHPNPVPHADFVTTTTHKTLRGPRAGLVLCREQYAKDLDRTVFPGVQGGPLDACHRRQGGLLQGGGDAGLRRLSATDRGQRPAPLEQPRGCRPSPRQRRHRQPLDARRRVFQGRDRQGCGSRARQSRHHREQERHPLRSEPANGRERDSDRHSGSHDTWHARAGDGCDRRPHLAGARLARATTAPSGW